MSSLFRKGNRLRAHFGFLSPLLILALALALLLTACTQTPPATQVENVTDTLHGVEITDPYRWLEDQEAPETRTWIDAQNRYTDSLLRKVRGREKLKQRFTELLKIDSQGSPTIRKGRYFYSKRSADQELTVYYYRDGFGGEEKVLLDPHGMSEDNRTSVSLLEVSEDGKLFGYGVRQGGEDEVEIHWREVETGNELPDVLERSRYFGVSLKPDKSGFYYTRFTQEEGPRLMFHPMGSSHSKDKLIFGKDLGPEMIMFGGLSEDGKYLLVHILQGSSAPKEIYVQDVARGGPLVPVIKGIDGKFSGSIGGNTLFVRTNWNAPNWRVLRIDLRNPARRNWREIVPENKKAVLSGMSLAGGKLFLNYMREVNTEIKVVSATGQSLGEVKLPSLGTAGAPSGRWSSKEAFYSFSSFHIPRTTFRYNTESGEQDIWFRSPVEIDSDSIEVSQVWYDSKDGTRIPMFLVHKKGLELNGRNPTYLTGYGGFNISRRPSFSSTAVAWVEQGGVYALPNLRGGGEFGEEWHQAGMFGNKQNVFDDFHSAAEWLIANNYTNPKKLAIAGGSNGGLLVGAAFTQRPDLFQAVICAVPLLDMVRYHQFLVARFWIPEYGSSKDPEQFEYIHKYSPYHNVKPGTDYPAIMFVTGDSDTRVAPLHARKMAALMQSAQGGTRPILLHYDTKGGHSGGGTPTSKRIDDASDNFAFLFWQLDVPVK